MHVLGTLWSYVAISYRSTVANNLYELTVACQDPPSQVTRTVVSLDAVLTLFRRHGNLVSPKLAMCDWSAARHCCEDNHCSASL